MPFGDIFVQGLFEGSRLKEARRQHDEEMAFRLKQLSEDIAIRSRIAGVQEANQRLGQKRFELTELPAEDRAKAAEKRAEELFPLQLEKAGVDIERGVTELEQLDKQIEEASLRLGALNAVKSRGYAETPFGQVSSDVAFLGGLPSAISGMAGLAAQRSAVGARTALNPLEQAVLDAINQLPEPQRNAAFRSRFLTDPALINYGVSTEDLSEETPAEPSQLDLLISERRRLMSELNLAAVDKDANKVRELRDRLTELNNRIRVLNALGVDRTFLQNMIKRTNR